MGGNHFVPPVFDWSLVLWVLFDIENKSFLLGYWGQDWWCVESRVKTGGGDTLIVPREEMHISETFAFAQRLLNFDAGLKVHLSADTRLWILPK